MRRNALPGAGGWAVSVALTFAAEVLGGHGLIRNRIVDDPDHQSSSFPCKSRSPAGESQGWPAPSLLAGTATTSRLSSGTNGRPMPIGESAFEWPRSGIPHFDQSHASCLAAQSLSDGSLRMFTSRCWKRVRRSSKSGASCPAATSRPRIGKSSSSRCAASSSSGLSAARWRESLACASPAQPRSAAFLPMVPRCPW